jgi:hypothetical protein
MMELPDRNNVYGLLIGANRLSELASLLQHELDVGDLDIGVKVSQFDGTETLSLNAEFLEFKAYPTGSGGEVLFNGAVAGDSSEVCAFVEKLYEILRENDFWPTLEVYDENRKCVAEYKAQQAIPADRGE